MISWLLRCLIHTLSVLIELLALLCLPFGDTAPRFVCWLRGWIDER